VLSGEEGTENVWRVTWEPLQIYQLIQPKANPPEVGNQNVKYILTGIGNEEVTKSTTP
jgi:hypothetical protein